MPLTAEAVAKVKATIDAACKDPHNDIPGASVVVVGRDGKELVAHAAGLRGLAASGGEEKMTLDSVFWIASCTKMLVGLSCMQLVERGVLRLDDGNQVESLCPEFNTLRVLRKDGTWEDKRHKITLRMLLTHTAGFGYSFFNERLRDWAFPAGLDEFSGREADMLSPLLFQPGEGWEYGVGVDWAGIVLMRATGTSLNDYIQENVLAPLGLKGHMTMLPSAELKSRLAYMHSRLHDGSLVPRDHLMRAPLVASTDEERARCFNSGGAGMFANPRDYTKVLAVLLNDGTCPRTGAKLLSRATVEEMFRNQIPRFPNAGRQAIPAAKPDLTLPVSALYPVDTDNSTPQGWGLTFMLPNGGATGRAPNTGHWAGLANLWWWCDREKGVAGMVCTQILPFADPKVLGLWVGVEAGVYAGLQ